MIYHIHSTDLWKADPTNNTNSSVDTEAQILLSLSYVAEGGTNIQAGPELYGVVEMVWESIVLNTMI